MIAKCNGCKQEIKYVEKESKVVYCSKCKKWCANLYYGKQTKLNLEEEIDMTKKSDKTNTEGSLKSRILKAIEAGNDDTTISKDLECRRPYVSLIRKQNKK